MAKRLGVTRGSFYWHFANALDFEAAVLGEWEERWTNRIIAAVEDGSPSPGTKLKSLIQRTAGLDASIYASAKRMAQNLPELSALMDRVDSPAHRLRHVHTGERGHPGADRTRAG
jgi:AcrR family transcriptional regulator